MSTYLFDTDMLTLYLNQHPVVVQRIVQHLTDCLATTIITLEEIVGGWTTSLRQTRTPQQVALGYDRLTQSLQVLQTWPIVSFSLPAIQQYEQLKQLRLNVGKNDLRIAAIALHTGAIVITRNLRDFRRVPGLTCEDWSV